MDYAMIPPRRVDKIVTIIIVGKYFAALDAEDDVVMP